MSIERTSEPSEGPAKATADGVTSALVHRAPLLPDEGLRGNGHSPRNDTFWSACHRVAEEVAVPAARQRPTTEAVDPVRSVQVAGLVLHPLNVSQVVNEIVLRVITGERLLLANHNLHSLYLHQRDAEVRRFYKLADRIIIDGAPILWMASRRASGLSPKDRVGSTDWLGGLLHVAGEANLSIAFLAGKPGVAERAREEILRRFPELNISVRDGYFDTTPGSAGNEATHDWLDKVRPDVLLVGMGMPRQEQWVAANYARIKATVTCTVGGCLDYVGGEQSLAPRWMGRLGVEWVYRLSRDPARLWRRYLLEPPAIALRLAITRAKLRRAKQSGNLTRP